MSININDVLKSRITAKTIEQRFLTTPRTFDKSEFFYYRFSFREILEFFDFLGRSDKKSRSKVNVC